MTNIFFDWSVGEKHWREAKEFIDHFGPGCEFHPGLFDDWLYDKAATPALRKRIKQNPGVARWQGKWRINQAGPNPFQFHGRAFMIMVITKGLLWKVCSIKEAESMINFDRIIQAAVTDIKRLNQVISSLSAQNLSYEVAAQKRKAALKVLRVAESENEKLKTDAA